VARKIEREAAEMKAIPTEIARLKGMDSMNFALDK
jgi:hypothetical protein